jgi:hypothetical protein
LVNIMTTKNIRIPGARLVLTLTFLAAALGVVGCGGDGDNNNPDQGPVDLGPPVDQGDEDLGTDAGVDAGCFTGTPSTSLELINACPLTGCAPFDNEARLPLLGDNGELPPLP